MNKPLRNYIAIIIVISFFFTSLGIPLAMAQFMPVLPGQMVTLSPAFAPALIKGIKVHPENPFQFDFIIDAGDSELEGEMLEDESSKIIRYFLASLTIPEDEMWVNLSPQESDRIVPHDFGQTEMGRDLLAQDYILKQLTASLMYPEDELGALFWEKVYDRVQEEYRDKEIQTEVFNKVWIVPKKAIVYEGDGIAYVVESKLKVMLEEDYKSTAQGSNDREAEGLNENSKISTDMIREIILPAIEKEVNEGEHFAKLRQIYSSFILAAWYKKKLKNTLLNQVYADNGKINGVDHKDERVINDIYDDYLEAFKVGVYNYIKEEYDPVTQNVIPRKYFSGGTRLDAKGLETTTDKSMLAGLMKSDSDPGKYIARVQLLPNLKASGNTKVIGDLSSALHSIVTTAKDPGKDNSMLSGMRKEIDQYLDIYVFAMNLEKSVSRKMNMFRSVDPNIVLSMSDQDQDDYIKAGVAINEAQRLSLKNIDRAGIYQYAAALSSKIESELSLVFLVEIDNAKKALNEHIVYLQIQSVQIDNAFEMLKQAASKDEIKRLFAEYSISKDVSALERVFLDQRGKAPVFAQPKPADIQYMEFLYEARERTYDSFNEEGLAKIEQEFEEFEEMEMLEPEIMTGLSWHILKEMVAQVENRKEMAELGKVLGEWYQAKLRDGSSSEGGKVDKAMLNYVASDVETTMVITAESYHSQIDGKIIPILDDKGFQFDQSNQDLSYVDPSTGHRIKFELMEVKGNGNNFIYIAREYGIILRLLKHRFSNKVLDQPLNNFAEAHKAKVIPEVIKKGRFEVVSKGVIHYQDFFQVRYLEGYDADNIAEGDKEKAVALIKELVDRMLEAKMAFYDFWPKNIRIGKLGPQGEELALMVDFDILEKFDSSFEAAEYLRDQMFPEQWESAGLREVKQYIYDKARQYKDARASEEVAETVDVITDVKVQNSISSNVDFKWLMQNKVFKYMSTIEFLRGFLGIKEGQRLRFMDLGSNGNFLQDLIMANSGFDEVVEYAHAMDISYLKVLNIEKPFTINAYTMFELEDKERVGNDRVQYARNLASMKKEDGSRAHEYDVIFLNAPQLEDIQEVAEEANILSSSNGIILLRLNHKERRVPEKVAVIKQALSNVGFNYTGQLTKGLVDYPFTDFIKETGPEEDIFIFTKKGLPEGFELADSSNNQFPAVEEDSSKVGGIALDSSQMDFEVRGKNGVDCLEDASNPACFSFDFTSEQIEMMRQDIDGFIPVIINMQPVLNLPLLLGVKQEELEGPNHASRKILLSAK